MVSAARKVLRNASLQARNVASRQDKVYVDYLQNGHGRLSNERFHIGNARRRLARLQDDPLADLRTASPDMVRALTLLGKIVA